MNDRPVSVATTTAMMVLTIVALALRPAAGQGFWDPATPKLPMAKTWAAYKAKLPPYRVPRTPDGVPDFRGEWGTSGGAGGDDIEDHEFVDVTTPPQESFISDPADGKVPYTPWGLAKRNEIRAGLARGWPGESGVRLYADPATFCFTTIGPRFGAVEIVQQPGVVIMVGANLYRVIPTDGRPPLGPGAKFWLGVSRGRWDGDTLVVEVTGLNGRHWFDSVGNYYTENTRMVERYTLVDANTIDYEITVEDPTVYARPWKMNFPRRRAGTGGVDNKTGKYNWRDTIIQDRDPYAREVWENNCREGNIEHIKGVHDTGFKWFTGVTPPR